MNNDMKSKRKKLCMLLASCFVACTGTGLYAQEDGLRLHFDFEQVNGTSVTDASTSGIIASLKNGAKVEEMGKYHVLNLGNQSGYLDLTEKTGALFKEMDSYTVSMYYRVDENASLSGAGFFLWSFSTSMACTASEGKYSAYRLNAQRFANSTGGYQHETGIEIGGESEKGQWIHVLYTQNGKNGTLYLNGVRKGSNSSMPANSENFNASIPYVWIGRAPFSADNYLKQTLVSDIRLYGKVLGTAEINALSQITEDLEHEFRYGTPGDFTALRTAIREAEDFLAGHAAIYPEAAVAIYLDEINMAKTLAEEGKVNQNVIDKQIKALAAAQNTLKATDGFEFDDEDVVEGYDTDKGFRHPGALHTDEDFERIRQQLKDGNAKVIAAYNVLKNAAYSQSNAATYPVETIVRGGGVGENYINAARGATIAYQNALRWKIDRSEEHARHAVDVLMAWARTTKAIGGDSNYALAAGLYGYAFANAAELVRDYEGWNAEDFAEFKRWMLNVWYPSCIGFLRGRNGTWENSGGWGKCPGHYWSNWGLCNVLAVMSIGILCDDVFLYNQGLSFYKYDQVGTFVDPRTANPILNDGLTEFIGNLVVTTQNSELETGAYGKLGQMQESGRDIGHAAMAAGLAVDVAHIGWNQGDDLFSYMDNRLAAGIEYLAAQTQSVPNLPWTDYHYADRGFAWWDNRSWLQKSPALGEQIRPYWGTVIGHYEGIKGVKMPFSEMAYEKMGIDGGGQGSVSGGYDHMGYSVLMNTRDFAQPDQVPTPLTPVMEYNGTTVPRNELGGLTNTYAIAPTNALPVGTIVTLKPQLPVGTADTGKWKWNNGETSKDITIVANKSSVWRVTYTNEKGVESEQAFTIAVAGDCEKSDIIPFITANGNKLQTRTVNILYGNPVTLEVQAKMGWGYYTWENGATGPSITLPNVTTSRNVSVLFIGQGGRKQKVTFHINVQIARPDITVNGGRYTDSSMAIVEQGDNVTLSVTPSDFMVNGSYLWNDDSTGDELVINDIQTSGTYSLSYTAGNHSTTLNYQIYVKDDNYRTIPVGYYYIRHRGYDTYLTNHGNGTAPSFEPKEGEENKAQQWYVDNRPPSTACGFMSLLDQAYLKDDGTWKTTSTRMFRLSGAKGITPLAIQKSARSGKIFWNVDENGNINFAATEEPNDYPFEFIPIEGSSIPETQTGNHTVIRKLYYTLDGIRTTNLQKGIYIRQTLFNDGTMKQEKIVIR